LPDTFSVSQNCSRKWIGKGKVGKKKEGRKNFVTRMNKILDIGIFVINLEFVNGSGQKSPRDCNVSRETS